MTKPGSATAEQQRLEQQRYIQLAISGKHWRPVAEPGLRSNSRPSPSPAQRQVILTAHKHSKRFESPVSVSAIRKAVYQMERHGWTVDVGEVRS